MDFVALLSDPQTWIALATLTAMEIVLGIDNVIFIAILVGRVPTRDQRERLRRIGLLIALGLRLVLLFSLTWLMGLTEPLFTILDKGFSGKSLILLAGGLFLIGKSAHEMYVKLELDETKEHNKPAKPPSAAMVLVQVALIDVVFSLDSVITAVGMARQLPIMVTAMLISVAVMMVFASSVGNFVDKHPAIKLLALSFLLLIGVMLVAEGFGEHIPKGYIYFSMAFALVVELLNMRLRKKNAPVHLHRGAENLTTPAP